jgi:cysteine desulfurase/selenocysteine lyase
MLDIKKVREDFPILKKKMNGFDLVYLDSGATSLKPQSVIDAEAHFYRDLGANIHRGVYKFSQEATEEVDQTREKVAKLINAPKNHEVIFTRGSTESINLVAYTWGRKYISEGDEILLSEMEHHSNLIPWQILAEEKGAKLKFIPINKSDVTFDLSNIGDMITEKTKLVAVTGMSNVTGVLTDLKPIIQTAHLKGAKVLVDGAQLVSHHPVDVSEMDCDFLAFSAHKMCGPTGLGVLYGKEEILESMPPFHGGGDMILQVWKDKATYAELPAKFEGGTPNIAGIIGYGRTIDYLNELGMDNIREHEIELTRYALEKTKEIDDLTVYGSKDYRKKGGIFSFNLGNVHPHDLGTIMDRNGIAVRVGHHCCQPLMRFLGVAGTSRASFYFYNTKDEIDKLIIALDKVREVFVGF